MFGKECRCKVECNSTSTGRKRIVQNGCVKASIFCILVKAEGYYSNYLNILKLGICPRSIFKIDPYLVKLDSMIPSTNQVISLMYFAVI